MQMRLTCNVYLAHMPTRHASLIDSECCRECAEAGAEGRRIGRAMQSTATNGPGPATAAKAVRPATAAKAPRTRGKGKVRAASRRLPAFAVQITMELVMFPESMSDRSVVSRGYSPCHRGLARLGSVYYIP